MNSKKNMRINVLLTLLLALGLLSGRSFISIADADHTPHDDKEFTKWENTDSLPDAEGSYYLANDVVLNNTWEVSCSIDLCLNGHGITYVGEPAVNPGEKASVIYVGSGGKLDLYDCGNNAEHKYQIRDDEVTIFSPELSMEGGEGITEGEFTGGYITGGKGVFVNDPNNNTDSMTYGGGVYVDGGGTFTMNGGNIIWNEAGYGGGVYVRGGTFTKNGGNVISNKSGDIEPAYTVSFSTNGHGPAPGSQVVIEGNKVTRPADPSDDGWVFRGWYREAACRNEWKFDKDTVTGNMVLYAGWTGVMNDNPAGISPAMKTPELGTAPPVNTKVTIGKQTYKVLSAQKVSLTKAKNAKTVTVPTEMIIEGVKLKVVSVSAGAFSKSKAKTAVIGSNINQLCAKAFTKSKVSSVVLKTDKLTKKSTKNCMKGTKAKKVTFLVDVGNKKANNRTLKKYDNFLTNKNLGLKSNVKVNVKVKAKGKAKL